MTYIVTEIKVEGKNKTEIDVEYTGAEYYHDANNNLVILDQYGDLVVDIHNYNYTRIRIKKPI